MTLEPARLWNTPLHNTSFYRISQFQKPLARALLEITLSQENMFLLFGISHLLLVNLKQWKQLIGRLQEQQTFPSQLSLKNNIKPSMHLFSLSSLFSPTPSLNPLPPWKTHISHSPFHTQPCFQYIKFKGKKQKNYTVQWLFCALFIVHQTVWRSPLKTYSRRKLKTKTLCNLRMAETFFCLIYSHWKKKSQKPKKLFILFILYIICIYLLFYGCPIPASVEGHLGPDSEQLGLAEGASNP